VCGVGGEGATSSLFLSMNVSISVVHHRCTVSHVGINEAFSDIAGKAGEFYNL